MTFYRHISAEPSAAAGAEYLAIERELRRRIEYCLNVIQDEGSLAPADNARRARILFTIVNGLSIAQALRRITAGHRDRRAVRSCRLRHGPTSLKKAG